MITNSQLIGSLLHAQYIDEGADVVFYKNAYGQAQRVAASPAVVSDSGVDVGSESETKKTK